MLPNGRVKRLTPPGNLWRRHKRVYRVMKVHGLLLDRHVGGDERRHDGRIAVDERNGFEIGCDNGERVRVVFALDCCDREAMSFLATTGCLRHSCWRGSDVPPDRQRALVRAPCCNFPLLWCGSAASAPPRRKGPAQ